MKLSTVVFTILALATIFTLVAVPQDLNETDVVATALDLISTRCDVLSRDQACYGHAQLRAEPRLGAGSFSFATEGDIEDLAKIQSLRLSGLDVAAGTWGVTLMQLRANLPEAHAENVTLFAFGDVALDNAVLPTTEIPVTVSVSSYINARMSPSTEVGPAGTLAPGQSTLAVERLADNSWLRVRLPESEATGWVRADLLQTEADINTLNVADRAAPFYQPMQAFYFSSDSNALTNVPTNGLLIQTPEGVGEVQLLINEISIQLGSTVFFEAEPGNEMRISTLEGHADVRANGVEFTAFAGTTVTVPLDENLAPTGSPTAPIPYNMQSMQQLPLAVLKRAVEVAPPLTYEEIEVEQNALILDENLDSGDADEAENEGDIDDDGGRPECPGNSCDAPGQNRGEGGNAGQGKGNNN